MLGAFLFFAAPPFRQAVRVSLGAWSEAVRPARLRSQPALVALARQAEAHHDPEGLAFAAVRLHDDRESARLADEAVQLDATIIWIYAVIAVRHPLMPTGEWVPKLEHWAPENAFVHLINAQSIREAIFHKVSKVSWEERAKEVQSDPAWQAAMAAAFAAPKFDDYVDRLANLDRNVEMRYRFDDPYEVLFGAEQAVMIAGVNGRFSSSDADDAQSFAKSLIEEGQKLENRGNRKGAAGKYWAVARFGQLLDSQGHGFDHQEGAALQAMAYRQLGALWEEQGDHNEAALFAYLAEKFDRPLVTATRNQAEWAWGTRHFHAEWRRLSDCRIHDARILRAFHLRCVGSDGGRLAARKAGNSESQGWGDRVGIHERDRGVAFLCHGLPDVSPLLVYPPTRYSDR